MCNRQMFFTCLKCSTHAQVGMHAAVHPGESCCTPAAEHNAGCVKAPPCAWAHLERCSNIRLHGCTSRLRCCSVQIWVQVMSLVTSLGQLLGTLPPKDPVGFLIVSANSGPAGHAHLSSDWLTQASQAHLVAFSGDSMLLRAPTLCVIVACLQANWCQRRLPCSSCFATGTASAATSSHMSNAARCCCSQLALLQSALYRYELVAWLLHQARLYGHANRDWCSALIGFYIQGLTPRK